MSQKCEPFSYGAFAQQRLSNSGWFCILMLFRRLKNGMDSFEVSVRYYKFSKFFVSSLRVFCIEFGAWRFGGMHKTIPKLFPYSWKLKPKGSHNRQQIIIKKREKGLGRIGRPFGSESVSKSRKVYTLIWLYWCFCVAWQIVGAIWTPTGFSRGPQIAFFDIEANKQTIMLLRNPPSTFHLFCLFFTVS